MMKKSYKDIKICCYAMCASEPEEFIDRWLESMKGADYITVLITKKDDSNFAYFKKKQELPEFKDKLIIDEKEIKPWRFDVARNESMKLIPEDADALICTDIDEILIDDFWDDYRKCIFEHPDFDRIYYRYAWSHDAQSNPSIVFWYDKATQAKGWKWRYPVHEELICDRDNYKYEGEYSLDANKVYLHHYPDQTKSRSSYLKLLELRAEESPEDSYGLFYLQREYSFVQDYENAIKYASQLYARLVINNDNSYMMKPAVCVSLGTYYNEINLKDEAEFFFRRAIELDPEMRDSYICLAQMLAYQGKYKEAYLVIDDMDKNSKYIEDWRIQPWCWRKWKRLQILADCKCWEMKYDEASQLFKEAYNDIVELEDFTEAYNQNFFTDLSWLQQKLGEQIV